MQNAHNTSDSADVTGVILAGGRSGRMGRDKATLVLGDRSLFSRALEMQRSLFNRVLIAGSRPDLALPEVPCVPDHFPGSSLGGLHGGLSAAVTPWIFVAPCDLGHPDSGLARFLLTHRKGEWDAIVPLTPKGFEPVFALYHRRCLEPMAAMLARGECRIQEFLGKIRVCGVKVAGVHLGWERALHNLNTPEDLRRFGEGRL